MRVSLLIPTYQDEVALRLILEALLMQTYKNFEVIIVEDDNSLNIKKIIEDFPYLDIKHVSHENKGNRKAIIMNRALAIALGEYIIFIDGDTIPYSTFIESHVLSSAKKVVLCGRRVNLGDNVSLDLREGKIKAIELEKKYFRYYIYLNKDNIRHYEQGFYFKVNGFLQTLLSKYNKNAHILASNFSCYKEDIYIVNGFDEDLPFAPNRDDTDLEWRMVAIGCKMKSIKYCANMFHLNHLRSDRGEEESINMEIIFKKKENKEYIAKNGIKKL